MVEARKEADDCIEVGEGAYRYEVDLDWPQMPDGLDFVEVSAAAVDSEDRVHAFNRGEHPLAVFTASGEFVKYLLDGHITRAHGLTIGPDDAIYTVDDADHTVKKFSADGELLLALGTSGQYSDTGATSVDYRHIKRSGPPFNYPTNLALGPRGQIYVADGYGNARIHKFSPTGELLLSWGEPGDGPGEFHVPHGIAVDADGRVWVADRENCRIQRFSPEGEFIDVWAELARPTQLFIDRDGLVYVTELGYQAGAFLSRGTPDDDPTGGRVSILTADGALLSRWGGGERPTAPGDFFAPHDIRVDSEGSVYVSEVNWSAGGKEGLVPRDCHTIQRFVRKRQA